MINTVISYSTCLELILGCWWTLFGIVVWFETSYSRNNFYQMKKELRAFRKPILTHLLSSYASIITNSASELLYRLRHKISISSFTGTPTVWSYCFRTCRLLCALNVGATFRHYFLWWLPHFVSFCEEIYAAKRKFCQYTETDV